MSGGPGVQYSPDGRWWWDGSQWRPVTSPAPPQPAPAPPQPPAAAASQPPGPPPVAPQPPGPPQSQPPFVLPPPSRGGGPPAWAIGCLVGIPALLILGVVGLTVASHMVASTASSKPAIPSPSISAVSPGSQGSPISGIDPAQVRAALARQGYTCTSPSLATRTGGWECDVRRKGIVYGVVMSGDGTTVSSVDLTVARVTSTPTDADATAFFTSMTQQLGSSSGAPQLNGWIQQNVPIGGDTTVGSLYAHLQSNGLQYNLHIRPASD